MRTRTWPPRDRSQPLENVPPLPAAEFDPLAGAVGDLSDALRHMLKGTPTLQTANYVVPASGVVTDTYNVPYAALAVISLSANPLVVTSTTPGTSAPGPGPGAFNVPVRGFAAVNIEGRVWSIYGGSPGDLITVTAFTKAVPPDVTPGPLGSTPAGPSLTAYGKVTTPAALANIAVISQPAAGVQYVLDVYYYVNGTPASPADDDNMRILWNGNPLATLPVDGASGGIMPPKFSITTPAANGANSCIVAAIGLATTGAIYHATIVATPLAAP